MINILPVFWREIKVDLLNVKKFVTYLLSTIFLLLLFATAFSVNINLIPYDGHLIKFSHFFIPGILALQIFLLLSKTFSVIRIDNNNNVITAIVISKTSFYSYYEGKLLANIFLTLVRVIILALIGWIIFGLPVPISITNVLLFLYAIIIGSCIWFSIGFICGIFIVKEESRDFVLSIIAMPITFASSVYYNIDKAPIIIKKIALFNPLTYNCNVLRESFLGIQNSIFTEMLILALIAVVLITLANLSLRFFIK